MANITISTVCNMKCPYCFAGEFMEGAKASQTSDFITLEDFGERLAFLERSGVREIRLIGGEPTLHPQFPEIIRMAQAQSKLIWIFSHGLMPERAIACLEQVPFFDCIVLVNTNAMRTPNGPEDTEVSWRMATLKRLGFRAILGFTIYRADFDLEPVFKLMKGTGCRRSIRLGLANPILLAENEFLRAAEYPLVGQRIVHFARRAAELDIALEFDCGFVRCMFSDEDLQVLHEANIQFGWHCNPVLDIGLDGQAIHCFPLTGRFQTPFDADSDAGSLMRQLQIQASAYRAEGVFSECPSCSYKLSGECIGGCLSATMRRLGQDLA